MSAIQDVIVDKLIELTEEVLSDKLAKMSFPLSEQLNAAEKKMLAEFVGQVHGLVMGIIRELAVKR